ncbi:MAG: phosphotransferase [Deltaproteobacteria bacterium]|nr:phosphotransferase [Deltaproteobacteria bacterium]
MAPVPSNRFPSRVEELSPELLTSVMAERTPGVRVEEVQVAHTAQCGDGFASTADRVSLDLRYAPGCDFGLPSRILLKTMLMQPHAPRAMYLNEVRFYRDIRHELPIEAPQAYGSLFDEETGQFGVLMEDLALRSARFPNATTPIRIEEMRSLVDTLATLHARYWASPRLEADLAWVATPCSGGMFPIFDTYGLELIKDQVQKNEFKAELIRPLDRTLDQLWEQLWKVQKILASEPHTLLHGDPHIGNTYLLPDAPVPDALLPHAGGGLLDWQLMVKGRWAHDFTYLLVTGLDTELRRSHERELIDFYLDGLRRRGVESAPSAEQAWRLYRQSVIWGLVIGWLITPPTNYGEAITVANLTRLVAAVQDLETLRALDD